MSSEGISRDIVDPQDDWATYEFQWTPDYVSWYYNGQEVRKAWASDDPAVRHMRERDQTLYMNFWVPNFNAWRQGFQPTEMPWYALYDYVEYHEYVPEDQSFRFSWRDDFDFIDQQRWRVTDNATFPENDCIFYQDQVYTENGQLVLKLEPMNGGPDDGPLPPPTPEGWQDSTPSWQDNSPSWQDNTPSWQDDTPIYQPPSQDSVNDMVPSDGPLCTRCEGILGTIETLQERLATLEVMLEEQNTASACF